MDPEWNNVALRLNYLFLDNICVADLITKWEEARRQEDELTGAVRQQSQGIFFNLHSSYPLF